MRFPCRTLGVPEPELFITADLYEARNLPSVVKNIMALKRIFRQKVLLGLVRALSDKAFRVATKTRSFRYSPLTYDVYV